MAAAKKMTLEDLVKQHLEDFLNHEVLHYQRVYPNNAALHIDRALKDRSRRMVQDIGNHLVSYVHAHVKEDPQQQLF